MGFDLAAITLTPGFHGPEGGEYCMLEAAAAYSGLEWTDDPETVNPDIARLCRALNDWGTQADRDQLKDLIPLAVQTGGTYSQDVSDAVSSYFHFDSASDEFEFMAPANPMATLCRLIDMVTFTADMLEGVAFAIH